MLAKNRPVQLALAVITLAVQVIYILIEMNALAAGSGICKLESER
jgi:hypothetical protein